MRGLELIRVNAVRPETVLEGCRWTSLNSSSLHGILQASSEGRSGRVCVVMHWLTRHYKQYPIPELVYAGPSDVYDYLAHYETPYYSNTDSGRIVLFSSTTASTIAHEYRHHIQFCKGVEFSYKYIDSPYYYDLWDERDALLFEVAMTGGDECSVSWLDGTSWIVPGRIEAVNNWLY